MTLNKLIRVSRQQAEAVYNIVLEKLNRDNEKWMKKQGVEKQIGRYLHKWEICHHINKIKTDNQPQNLMAFKNQNSHRKFETHKPINPTDIIFSGKN